jgi:AcrR family transcriptional regulator
VRRGRFSVEQVVDAALACVAERGLDDLTMRAVAARLGVSPMGLYRYVTNRDELVSRAVDQTLASVRLPPHPQPGHADRWLVAMAGSVRECLLPYPGTAEHLLLHGPTGRHTMTFMDRVCHVLADTGRTPRQTAWAYDWLMTTVAVYIAKQHRLDRDGGAPRAATAFAARAAEHALQLPHLRRVVHAFTGDSAGAFDRAVRGVVDALHAGAPPPAPPADGRQPGPGRHR